MDEIHNDNLWRRPWWRQPEAAVLILLVLGIYFSRLTSLPIRGEESRWARAAAEVIETGDWVVPRQQGKLYVDRPPMASWLIAMVAGWRGQVDLVAVRLPSVLAILATSLVVFAYARTFLSPIGALAAGAIYATLGQLLQIGRFGENDAVFALLVSGSLLGWHWGYLRGGSGVWMWAAGYSFAGLGTLQKGPQAPVYFAAVVGVYLLLNRDLKKLFTWSHMVGMGCFTAIFLAWQIPFLILVGWDEGLAMWTRSAGYRYQLAGLAEHLATYPLETFGCLLPWSPLVLGLCSRRVRASFGPLPPQAKFLITALCVTYPSVWFAANGHSRYFIPLYPSAAILLAMLVDRFATAAARSELRCAWDRYLVGCAVLIGCGGIVILAVTLADVEQLRVVAQPLGFAVAFFITAIATSLVLVWACKNATGRAAQMAVVAIAAFLGMSYTGAVLNGQIRTANDMTRRVEQLKSDLPAAVKLVSFGPIEHRFAYYYQTFISELNWPKDANEVPRDVEYFCFDRYMWDTPGMKYLGRGMYWETLPNELPFEWEEVAALPADRNHRDPVEVTVVVGRIIRRTGSVAGTKDAVRQ